MKGWMDGWSRLAGEVEVVDWGGANEEEEGGEVEAVANVG